MEKKKGPKSKRPTPEESEKMIEELEDISSVKEADEIPELDAEGEGENVKELPADIDAALPPEEPESVTEDILGMAADVSVQVVAVLGKKSVSMRDLAKIRIGEVIELNRPLNEVVDLVAGNRLIAKGELVDVDGKMGVKIIKMVK